MISISNRTYVARGTGTFLLAAAATLLAGCGGVGQLSPGSPGGMGVTSNARSAGAVAAANLPSLPSLSSAVSPDTAATLYASDSLANTVVEYDTSTGAIIRTLGGGSSGPVIYPEGLFVSKGALYVANEGGSGSAVLVYKSGATSPSRILQEGAQFEPVDVAVGTDGTVYVANIVTGYSEPGNVEVFKKGSTTADYAISFGSGSEALPVYSVALDSSNNLYVGFTNKSNKGEINKYAPGSTKGVNTGFVIGTPTGMAFDKSGDLVAVDTHVVDVFQAGTDNPIRQFGSLTSGQYCAFTKSGTYLYVADSGANQVDEFHYSNGKLLSTTSLSDATGVALSPPEAL